jgi:serine protease Do
VFYDLDAGLLQITDKPGASGWQPATVGDSSKLKVGQWCLGTGHPGGYQRGRNPVVRLGRVLRVEDDGITTDCTLVGGDSGGPLFDMQGRVIGIHSRIGNSLTANVHVPVSAYRDNWDRLVKGDAWGSQPGVGPFIGVVGARDAKNAKIAYVNPGSPAEEAGIQVGDVITRFDGKPLGDFDMLSRAVRARQPGDRVRVELLRDGRTIRVDVTIGSREE